MRGVRWANRAPAAADAPDTSANAAVNRDIPPDRPPAAVESAPTRASKSYRRRTTSDNAARKRRDVRVRGPACGLLATANGSYRRALVPGREWLRRRDVALPRCGLPVPVPSADERGWARRSAARRRWPRRDGRDDDASGSRRADAGRRATRTVGLARPDQPDQDRSGRRDRCRRDRRWYACWAAIPARIAGSSARPD